MGSSLYNKMKTAIVIPYNKEEEITLQVLDRLKETTIGDDVYCIVVHGFVEPCPPIKHKFINKLVSIKNESYCKTINAGLREIPKDCTHVLMMGNDSFPDKEGWVCRLVELINKHNLVVISPDYTAGGKGRLISENEELWFHSMMPSISYFMTTESLKEIGLMDERFVGACYYSDDDYSRRVHQLYGVNKMARVKGMLWEHRCSVEGKALGVANSNQMAINYKIYNEKWG